MRYYPGSISISDELDRPLLRTVHRAVHLRFEQLYTSFYGAKEKKLWDTLTWRVRRLVEHSLLEHTELIGMKGGVLSLGENGELYLQSHESSLVERGPRKRRTAMRNQIWHDVELFDLQLAMRRAGLVAQWESEVEVKAANDFTTYRYAKDYDAVVTLQMGNKRGKLALEYERTPKTSKRYEDILQELNLEKRVGSFLYLVPNRQLHSFLLHALRGAQRRVMIALATEFAENPQKACLMDVRNQACSLLEDCLDAPFG